MTPNSPDDPLPAMRAEIDQMIAMAPEWARTVRAWFDSLKGQGFDDKQALYMTAAQLTSNPGHPAA